MDTRTARWPSRAARIRAAHQIQDVRPAAWLDARVVVAPGRRSSMRLGKRRGRRSIDTQVHPVLVKRGDLVGGHEAPASPGAHHDSVKDVLRGSGDDVVDRTHLLAIRGVNRKVLVKHLVGDRQASSTQRTLQPGLRVAVSLKATLPGVKGPARSRAGRSRRPPRTPHGMQGRAARHSARWRRPASCHGTALAWSHEARSE